MLYTLERRTIACRSVQDQQVNGDLQPAATPRPADAPEANGLPYETAVQHEEHSPEESQQVLALSLHVTRMWSFAIRNIACAQGLHLESCH